MKKIKAFSILITCVLSLALVFVSCDTFSGPRAPGGGNGDGKVTYTGTSGTSTYILEIILASGGSVPIFGDGYELTAGSDRSTGTVATFGGGSFTLQPSIQNAPIFGATVTEFGLTGLSGIITVTDGSIRNSPGTLTPVSGPSGNNQGGTTYTVTFSANGGSGTAPSSQTVTAGQSITFPSGSGLTRSGYTFEGWNTSSSGTGTTHAAGASYTVNGNATFYAKWVNVPVGTSYTVTFNANGATGSPPAAMTVTAGTSITLPGKGSLTKGDSTFEGWNTNSFGTGTTHSAGSSYTVNGNATFYAKWSTSAPPPPPSNIVGTWICAQVQYSTFKMVFNSNGTGTWYDDPDHTEPFTYTVSGDTITVTKVDGPQTARLSGGIIFWDFGMTFTKEGDTTTYTVSYNANGGSGSVASQTVNIGHSVTLPSGSGLSKTGYIFDGWNTNANGNGTNHSAGTSYTPFENVTLYAKWVSDDGVHVSTPGLAFTLYGNTYAVGKGTVTGGAVTIPSTYNGLPVTDIDLSGFAGTSITSITIPSSVTSIYIFAFDGCTSLSSITIPSSVTWIGDSAFRNCTSLTSVTIPSSVTRIDGSVFEGCTNLASVTIPVSVTSIGSGAFSNCTSLSSITFPASVTSIGYQAFANCTSLASVTFAGTIPSGGFYDSAFLNLGDLRDKYLDASGGIGTYIRSGTSPNYTWTKQ